MGFKRCIVTCCRNNSKTTPDKIFVSVPKAEAIRKKWYEAAMLKKYTSSTKYCCEDHFNLEKDVENWMYYKFRGKNIRMRKGVVPHKKLKPPKPIYVYYQPPNSDEEDANDLQETQTTSVETSVSLEDENAIVISSPAELSNMVAETLRQKVEYEEFYNTEQVNSTPMSSFDADISKMIEETLNQQDNDFESCITFDEESIIIASPPADESSIIDISFAL